MTALLFVAKTGERATFPRLTTRIRSRRQEVPSQLPLFYGIGPCLSTDTFMSNQVKKTGKELNFESAMDRLEAIVEQMESGKMLLEELIVRYEEGMKLVKICQQRLASAEQRIEIISRNSTGKPIVKDFEPATEPVRAAEPEEKETRENDEVRLF